MKFLIFADLHQFDMRDLKKINEGFDAIVFLGDITSTAIKCVIDRFPDVPLYGILGNHDDFMVFSSVNTFINIKRNLWNEPVLYKLKNINLAKETVGEVSITGLLGSVICESSQIGYTQEEALNLDIPAADILFSHDTGYLLVNPNEERESYQGFKAISRYIKEKKPKYNIFGHQHKDIQFMKDNTMCIGIYGCSIFDYDSGTVKKIF